MFEITGFEVRRRGRSILTVTALVVATIGLVVGIYPSIETLGIDYQTILENYPAELREAFAGNVTDLSSIEGFLVVELYQLVWLLILGGYVAYATSSTIAGEIEHRSMDLVLTLPISRTRLVVGKFLSMLPLILVVNGASALAVVFFVDIVGETIDVGDLLTLHSVSTVYLIACAGVGLLASVLFSRTRRAHGASIGAIFVMYLLDTLTVDTDYEFLGDLSLTRYIDPGEVLVEGTVDWTGMAVLVVIACLLVVLSAELFERRDIAG
ncbi:MAG: ABC transporter permease [Halobacteriota archaeon]